MCTVVGVDPFNLIFPSPAMSYGCMPNISREYFISKAPKVRAAVDGSHVNNRHSEKGAVSVLVSDTYLTRLGLKYLLETSTHGVFFFIGPV